MKEKIQIKVLSLDRKKVSVVRQVPGTNSHEYVHDELPELTKILLEKGKKAVLCELGRLYWEGEIAIYKGASKYNLLFNDVKAWIPRFLNNSNYDSKAMGEFIANGILKFEKGDYYHLFDEVKDLLALMSDKDHLLEVAKRSGKNLIDFANAKTQKDRAFSLALIKAGSHNPDFSYPSAFLEDIDFAIKAIKINAEMYKQLPKEIQKNKDIKNAYKESLLKHNSLDNRIIIAANKKETNTINSLDSVSKEKEYRDSI